ncbi:hypothetical protein VA603_13065 [Stenotrophomonas sp. MH1]|uniref:Uncharacterized protein n=1 Tax=Stenotrophomonas capsici TaxID=3110230 RepID=A0ABU5V5K9_9GAMM|nr:hypothetical protein [Stenotrophomonas sp. MH1]MEA5668472.1 hypothetical protein [Stenotrophomonas sp. MH1]
MNTQRERDTAQQHFGQPNQNAPNKNPPDEREQEQPRRTPGQDHDEEE